MKTNWTITKIINDDTGKEGLASVIIDVQL
jgi:hypothetical protein